MPEVVAKAPKVPKIGSKKTTPTADVATPAVAPVEGEKTILEMYEEFEAETLGRAAKGGSAELIREKIAEIMTAKKTNRVLLASVVRLMKKIGHEVANGTVRSAASKDYDLQKDADGHVWIVKE